MPVNSGAPGDDAAQPTGPASGPVSAAQALTAFLAEQGAFPAVAASLAAGLLARLALD